MRKCIITNERFPKKELIRVVRTPENEVVVDLTGKRMAVAPICVKIKRYSNWQEVKICLPGIWNVKFRKLFMMN